MLLSSPNDPAGIAIDRRALAFWQTPSLAIMMECAPLSPLVNEMWLLLTRSPHQPLITTYGFPDFRGIRRDLNLTLEQIAARWQVRPSVACAIELGWKPLTLSSAMWCCERLGVPVGHLFHDGNYVLRPLTRVYAEFLRDDLEQIHL